MLFVRTWTKWLLIIVALSLGGVACSNDDTNNNKSAPKRRSEENGRSRKVEQTTQQQQGEDNSQTHSKGKGQQKLKEAGKERPTGPPGKESEGQSSDNSGKQRDEGVVVEVIENNKADQDEQLRVTNKDRRQAKQEFFTIESTRLVKESGSGQKRRKANYGKIQCEKPATEKDFSDKPRYTKGLSEQYSPYTDFADDKVLEGLQDLVTSLPEDVSVKDSKALGASITQLDVALEKSTQENINREALVYVRFETGNRRVVEARFRGAVSAGSQRSNKLKLVDIFDEKSNQQDLKLGAELICIDRSGTCENRLLVFKEYQDGAVCKKTYAIHRSGEVRLDFKDISIKKQNDMLVASFKEQSGDNSAAYNRFMRYLKNTQEANLFLICKHHKLPQTPRFADAKLEAWAVPFGRARYSLRLHSKVPDKTKYNTQGEPIGVELREDTQDILEISGLLGMTQGPVQSVGLIKDVNQDEPPQPGSNELSRLVKEVRLVKNHGNGRMKFRFDLGNGGDTEIGVRTLIRQTQPFSTYKNLLQ